MSKILKPSTNVGTPGHIDWGAQETPNEAADGQSELTDGSGVTVEEVQEELRMCQQDAIALQIDNKRLRGLLGEAFDFIDSSDGYPKGSELCDRIEEALTPNFEGEALPTTD